MQAHRKAQSGFSILEVLLALAIFASVSLVALNLRNSVGVMENLVNQQLQAEQDVEQAFQIFSTDVRSTAQSSLGAYPIVAAGTSSFTFYGDVDRDGVSERVRYFLVTSTLNRGIIEPAGNPLSYTGTEAVTTAVANIVPPTSTSIFSYYDSTYAGSQSALSFPVDVAEIRAIKISIYVDVQPGKSPKSAFFSRTATARNLKIKFIEVE